MAITGKLSSLTKLDVVDGARIFHHIMDCSMTMISSQAIGDVRQASEVRQLEYVIIYWDLDPLPVSHFTLGRPVAVGGK